MPSRPVDNQPWYSGGLRFQCTGCGGCCTGAPGYVWVTKAEIQALVAALGMDAADFEAQFVRLVGSRRSLREEANGNCVLLDSQTRRCRVYAVRPRQCQTWPFWPSNLRTPKAWEEMARDCPGANAGRLVPLPKIQSQLDAMR